MEHVDVRSLKDLVVTEEFTESTFQEIQRTVFDSAKGLEELRRLLADWDQELGSAFPQKTPENLARGYCHYLNSEMERAEELLRNARNDPWGYYWLVRVTLDMNRRDAAIRLAEKAHERFPDFRPLTWLLVDVWITTGWEEEAEKLLAGMNEQERATAVYALLQGQLAELSGEYDEAIDLYRKACDTDPGSARALFHLGQLSAIHGDELEAIASLEACVQIPPIHVNALINLGILYEDRNQHKKAIRCYRTVLKYYPNHPRAKLYERDATASLSMVYDTEDEKKRSVQNKVLRTPITEFELSVRCRNCLTKLNIATVGDLIMKTEAELLAHRNFGDTSLEEIRNILDQHGLHLGQGLETREKEQERIQEELEQGVDPELLEQPIESLELSIRSRRCMERLKIRKVRELIRKSEVELMGTKNFGVTSLTEVKEKLEKIGLRLRE